MFDSYFLDIPAFQPSMPFLRLFHLALLRCADARASDVNLKLLVLTLASQGAFSALFFYASALASAQSTSV